MSFDKLNKKEIKKLDKDIDNINIFKFINLVINNDHLKVNNIFSFSFINLYSSLFFTKKYGSFFTFIKF